MGDLPQEKHLFSEWAECLKASQPIPCIQGQVFSPTSVDDIAKAIGIALEKDLSGLYHVANQEIFSRHELARQFLLLSGKKGKTVFKTPKELGLLDKRPLHSFIDCSKFIRDTGMEFTLMQDLIQSFLNKSKPISNQKSA